MKIDIQEIRSIDELHNRNEKVFRAALYYISQGIPVIPLPYGEKAVEDKGVYTGRCSARESKIREWFNPKTGRYRGGNIAFGCGDYYGQGGVFAIDVDNKYHERYGDNPWGPSAWSALVDEYGPIDGPVQRTPSGGIHILTQWRVNMVPSQNRLAPGIDTRGGHEKKISSHIVVWPSVVEDRQYQWEAGGDVNEPPQWLIESMGVSWKTAGPRLPGGRGNEGMSDNDIEEQVTLEKVAILLDCLNPDSLDYSQWVKVGQAIHSQHPGKNAMGLWDHWSQRGSRYKPGECDKRWPGFNANGPVRMATLFYYVQEYGDVSKIEPDKGGDEESFVADCIDEYNRRYALVLSGEQVKVIRKEQVPGSIQDKYKHYSIDAFRAFKSNDTMLIMDSKGNPKPVRKFDIWMASPARQSFDGLIMHPGKDKIVQDSYGHRFLNTWAGFAVEPVEGDWSLMKRHILDNLCSGNEEHSDWLLDWMADMVQDPANPKGCAVILGGPEGAGKGTLANALAHIFGMHAVIMSNSKHLASQFNDMLMDSVFLFADEVVYAGNNEVANMLKALVTEKQNTREAKFGAKEKVDQFIHLMMATNNDWKIAAGKDSRRWFILQVSDQVANLREYFEQIKRQMDNGGYEAMLFELLNRPVVSNLRYAPVTEELKNQRTMMQVHSIYDSLPAWISYVIDTGKLGADDLNQDMESKAEDGWPKIVDKAALWESYADWARRYKPKATIMATNVFYKKLLVLGFEERARVRTKQGRARTIGVPSYEELIEKAEKEMAIYVKKDQQEDM